MKILVFSDSHGHSMRMLDIIEEEKPDMIFHLGDHVDDTVDLEAVYPEIPLTVVRGNNDWNNAPDNAIITVEGINFFLTHGHFYDVHFSAEKLAKTAKAQGCQAALYGHTHIAEIGRYAGIAVANPGSITMPRTDLPSYLIINVQAGQEPQFELKYVDRIQTQTRKKRLNWFR